jgi:hypothetical protein
MLYDFVCVGVRVTVLDEGRQLQLSGVLVGVVGAPPDSTYGGRRPCETLELRLADGTALDVPPEGSIIVALENCL